MSGEPWIADYSWGRPDPAALRSLGCIGVMRYVGPGNRGRDLTRPELLSLWNAGLGVGLIWETTQTGAFAGSRQGAFEFETAARHADALGFPADRPIFFAVDTDVTDAQVRGPVADTFAGALSREALRPCRPYGEDTVLKILCGELKVMPCGWQCYAWSGGRRSPYRCLFQEYPAILAQTVDWNVCGPMPTDFLHHPDIDFDPPATTKDWLDVAELDDLRAVIARTVAQQTGWHLIIDGRPESLSGWLLNIHTMRKRHLPGAPADYPKILGDAIDGGTLPEMTNLGMRGAGDAYIGLLDLATVDA